MIARRATARVVAWTHFFRAHFAQRIEHVIEGFLPGHCPKVWVFAIDLQLQSRRRLPQPGTHDHCPIGMKFLSEIRGFVD
jgi:hypothetical protein